MCGIWQPTHPSCTAAISLMVVLSGMSGLLADTDRPVPVSMVDEYFVDGPTPSPLNGFHAYDGVWHAADGVLMAEPAAGSKLMLDEIVLTEGDVGAEIRFPDNQAGSAGLILKVGRLGIGADAFDGYEVALDPQAQCVRLGRHEQNFELIRDVPCRVPVDAWISLVVRLTPTRVEVLVDGQLLMEYDDGPRSLRSGKLGFRPWMRSVHYRNLWIRQEGNRREIPLVARGTDAWQLAEGWTALTRGQAKGRFMVESIPTGDATRHVQRVTFESGSGEVGIRHIGKKLDSGLAEGDVLSGYAEFFCPQPTQIHVTLESPHGEVAAESIGMLEGNGWQRWPFTLSVAKDVPDAALTLKLTAPGTCQVRRVWCEPQDSKWPESLSPRPFPRIAFVMRHAMSAPPAVGQDLWAAQPRAPGCSICLLDLSRPKESPQTIFHDAEGCIYDLNVSSDAQTLYFSYRRTSEEPWHIWRIQVDGTGLQQLTDGSHYDVSPCELPDGGVVFVSTRRFGYTVCQPGPASNLYRMEADGSDVRCISMNTLSDLSPQMLPDGRILFTRWEYIDRDLTFRQSLWTQYPDGSAYQLYYGNTIRNVGTFWQARPLPGTSEQLVATFAPHHGFPHGAIGLIDRSSGVETPQGVGYTYITREFPVIEDRRLEWAYRDPYPLTADTFLCSYGGGGINKYRLFLLDRWDRRRLLYEDPLWNCYFPIALWPASPAHRVPDRSRDNGVVEASFESASSESRGPDATGTLMLANVNFGLEPAVSRGTVKYLRVMEQVRKSEDLVSRAFDQSPVMSYGTYYAKRCWGTVPVEEDGSAHFVVPALREIYFQALDAEGREVQRMTSAVQLMPGERLGCVGCHEPRESTPPVSAAQPLAALRPPRPLTRPSWLRDGIVDFPTVVQPVLDKYCVRCHQGQNPDGGCDLSGDKTRYFNMAYDNLLGRSRSYRQHNMFTGEMLPEEATREKPLVHFYWLLLTPTAVNQPYWTGSHASRLLEYVEGNHAEQTIPLEDRQRIYLWIDANVPYYGTYAHSRPLSPGRRDMWTDPQTGQIATWLSHDFTPVYQRRCTPCHGAIEGTTNWEGRYAWINLTRPENSSALTAHLALSAGGRGIPAAKDGAVHSMFETTDDPDYQCMLEAIRAGHRQAVALPEADMEGFQGARPEH